MRNAPSPRCRAVASPMPLLPPVISATLPVKRITPSEPVPEG